MNRFVRGALALAALSIPCGACAQTPAKRDPKVQAILDQSVAAYKALSALHIKVSASTNGPADMMRGAPESIELRYQKPNKLYASITSTGPREGGSRKLVVSDGVSLWEWRSGTNAYTKSKAPSLLKAASLPNDLPEFDLLIREKDAFADLPSTTPLTLAGPDKIGGVDVDVLKTSAAEPGTSFTLSIQIMIGQKDHLIHGMTFEGSGKDTAGKDVKFDVRLTYDVVNTSPTFTAADFAFTPPPGSKQTTIRETPAAPPAKPKASAPKK